MNLTLGQPGWTQLFRELAVYGKPVKCLRDLARKLDDSLARIQLVDNGGAASLLSGWTVAGVKLGSNTSELGQLFPRVTKDSVATTVAAGSNGVNVNTFAGAGTLHAASTAGFPTSGTLTVVTGSGAQVVSYTGVAGNDFTGCSSSGAGVLATGGAISVCTVSLYTATGAAGLVAQGVGAYPLASLALTAQNASGLSATVVVGTLTGSEAVDTHYLTVFPDFVVNARNVFDGTQPEHAAMLAAFLAAIASAQSAVQGGISALNDAIIAFLGSRLTRTLNSAQGALINLDTKTNDGQITTDYSGVLQDLLADMADETSPAAQTVLKNVLAAGAASFPTTNDGKATLTGPALAEFAYAGTITAICTDATFGSEKFALTQRVSSTGSILQAKNALQIDKSFADPSLGIVSMTLNRLLTLSSGSANDFGVMSNWTLTGLSSSNVDSAGKLYPKVIAGIVDNTKWIQQLYSSSTLSAASLVAQSAEAAANATGVVLSAQNGSGLGGVVAIGSGPTAAHSGTINCGFWQVQNSQKNVADSWTVAIAQTSAGEFQDLFRVLLGYQANSAAANPTIPDGVLSAGTIPTYVVRDV